MAQPVTVQAADGEEVRITGGPTLAGDAFTPVADEKVLARLRPVARGKIVHADLNHLGNLKLAAYPDTFRGVCGLPLTPGVSPKAVLPYLEECIKQRGFVGFLLNPDPGECGGIETLPLGDRFWYPLYEKMVELDIPGHIHSTGCRSERLPYSLHFINEESIAVVSLLTSDVFKDFPTLKILVSHGGGALTSFAERFLVQMTSTPPYKEKFTRESVQAELNRFYYDSHRSRWLARSAHSQSSCRCRKSSTALTSRTGRRPTIPRASPRFSAATTSRRWTAKTRYV